MSSTEDEQQRLIAQVRARAEAIDSDAPVREHPGDFDQPREQQWDVLCVIAAGGILGAEARYGISKAFTHTGRQFPWSTVFINVVGCLLIGVLMVVVVELIKAHRLARPFLGVGILGGFTTFSTFAVDAERLINLHRPAMALLYILTTLVLGSLALAASVALTRLIGRRFT